MKVAPTCFGLHKPSSGSYSLCLAKVTVLISTLHLRTYTTVQSPSWEANWFAASEEIPRISRNPKVHYRTHKRPPTVPILGQPNPVNIPTSHLLEIHPNIINPSTPRSPQWSLSLRFPHQDPIHPPPLTHTRHMPSSPHSYRFCHPHNIGWGVQIIQLLGMQLRYDTIPVQSASANVSFYTNNSKMPNFELWHSCRKWAICYSARPISTCIYCSM